MISLLKGAIIGGMAGEFIGRQKECDRLRACMGSASAQLVVVYGRRRVGKTFLIDQFFGGRFDFKMTGLYKQPREIQLKAFMDELSMQSKEEHEFPKDWLEAFIQLRNYLSGLSRDEKHVVFFDEMPWMDTPKSGFLPAFEWFWNGWGAAQDNLVLLVCGSATSWMVDNLDNNKGGLFNRQTCRLYLEPFSLRETEEYLLSRNIRWERYDIAECYMTMGGIPFYLSQLDKNLSYTQNIDNIFFKKRALLWDEFPHLYASLFSNGDLYVKVVEALSSKRIGLSRTEITEKTGLPANGGLTKILDNLASTGFVRAYPYYGNKKRQTLYQLADYYTMFYYKFIKDNYGRDEAFWTHSIDNPARTAWAGFTFEQLCKDHIRQVKEALGISGVLTEESSWFLRGGDGHDGCQIDMLIDRRDRVTNLCEMKFSRREFEIDKDYSRRLQNKIDSFREATGTRNTLLLTFITSYGVRQNMYSGRVQAEVTLDQLFA